MEIVIAVIVGAVIAGIAAAIIIKYRKRSGGR